MNLPNLTKKQAFGAAVFGAAMFLQAFLATFSPKLAFALIIVETTAFYFLIKAFLPKHSAFSQAINESTGENSAALDLINNSENGLIFDSSQASQTENSHRDLNELKSDLIITEEISETASESENKLAECNKFIASLQPFPMILEIQNAQLSSVINNTESAAVEIITQVKEIRETISGMTSQINEQVLDGKTVIDKYKTAFEQNNEKLSAFREYLAGETLNNAEIMEQEQDSFTELISSTKALSKNIADVERVAFQTKMLALNASIEAAHAGEQGAGFAIVAQEVKRLSDESKQSVQDIKTGVGQVMSAVEKQLKARMERQRTSTEYEQQLEHETFSEVEQQFTNLFQQFDGVSAQQSEFLNRTTEQNQTLSAMMMDLIAQIQFQDITRQKIEHVMKALTQIKEQLSQSHLAANSESSSGQTGFSVESLLTDYVMEHQRITHSQIMGGEPAESEAQDAPPLIELF